VLVADVLTANQLMRLNHRLLKGLVLGSVGATSHTVILARSLRVPTLLDADAATLAAPGEEVIVDGDRGLVMAASSQTVKRYYAIQERTNRRRRERLEPLARRPAATRDGRRLEVGANASMPEEVAAAVGLGAEGVGLLRTELLFLDRATAPTEAEQFEAYHGVVDAAGGRPVIIRTFDIGGDKPAAYMGIPQEENPFLGCRGIRLYPGYQDLLRTQLRAIVRASAFGPVKVMAPMVATAAEAAWFRQQIEATQAELKAHGVKFDEQMPIGVMVEVPSISLAMEEVCAECDFLSIGTNDLCQYWMAVDRGNKAVAGLYNARQPSFLRLLTGIIDAAHKHGVWIGVCGEMAGDRLNLPLLVGMGVDEISVAPGEVLNLKAAVASLDSAKCREVLAGALKCASAEAVEAHLRSTATHTGEHRSILDANALLVGSEAVTKAEAIKEAVDALYVAGRTDRPAAVEDAVWAREQTYSTGLGYGFAVPHCKTDAIGSASLAVVKLRQPVEWGSSDGLPVGVVLLLAVPAADTTGMHMKVFAKLARKLMHEAFRERLSTAADAAAVETALREELQIE
jgi:fructose-specific PTS system IIA-like component